jgi:clan AA aspartic protease
MMPLRAWLIEASLLQGSSHAGALRFEERECIDVIHSSVHLLNPSNPDLQGLDVSALADSGAVHLCIPEHVALQLQLRELERREVVLADGRRRSVPYMGPVEVRFANRRCFTGAMVLGDEVLL